MFQMHINKGTLGALWAVRACWCVACFAFVACAWHVCMACCVHGVAWRGVAWLAWHGELGDPGRAVAWHAMLKVCAADTKAKV